MKLLKQHRLLAAIAAVAVVAAAVVAVLVLRGSDDDETASPERVEASSSLPSDEELDHEHEDGEEGEHEHDHIDTVDPNIVPADYVQFCDAFYVFANAYSNAADQLNQTGEAPAFLVAAATDFRAVADQTELEDEVRAGFEWFVDDVLRVENDATTEEQMAWSTFLNSACPA